LVVADLKKSASYTDRFSDRISFWIVVVSSLSASHVYLYYSVGRYLAVFWEALWLFFGFAALIFTAAAHLSPSVDGTGSSAVRAAMRIGGAFWNIFVFIVSAAMLAQNVLPFFPKGTLSSRFYGSCVFAVLVCLYGIYEARNVRTTFLKLRTGKLHGGERIRIVQFSDVHIGPFMSVGQIDRVVRRVIIARPDIVVVTGDLVDSEPGIGGYIPPYYSPFRESLRKISKDVPLGVWAVPGNHEYYGDVEKSLEFVRSCGIKVLRSEKAVFDHIVLLGADDIDHLLRGSPHGVSASERLVGSLSPGESEKFVLLHNV
jgi:hypothetical protein